MMCECGREYVCVHEGEGEREGRGRDGGREEREGERERERESMRARDYVKKTAAHKIDFQNDGKHSQHYQRYSTWYCTFYSASTKVYGMLSPDDRLRFHLIFPLRLEEELECHILKVVGRRAFQVAPEGVTRGDAPTLHVHFAILELNKKVVHFDHARLVRELDEIL